MKTLIMVISLLASLIQTPRCVSEVVYSIEPQEIGGHKYNILQGGCTDGKNLYLCMFERLDDNKTPSGYCAIFKVEMDDWKVVDTLHAVRFGHMNGCCIDDTGVMYVCDEDRLHLVNTADMSIMDEISVPYNTGAIAFDNITGHFYLRHGWGFYVCDKEFNIVQDVRKLDGFELNASCGIDIDSNGMYLNQFKNDNGTRINYLSFYSREGGFERTVDLTPYLKAGPNNEAEFAFRLNNYFYQGCYRTNNGGVLYKLSIYEN